MDFKTNKQALELESTFKRMYEQVEKLSKESSEFFSKDDLKRLKDFEALSNKALRGVGEAAKTNATSVLRQINPIYQRISANIEGARREIDDLQKKGDALSRKKMIAANNRLKSYLEELDKVEKKEAENTKAALRNVLKYQKALDRLSRSSEGTIFDPEVTGLGDQAIRDFDKISEYGQDKMQEVADTLSDGLSGGLDSIQSRFDKLLKGSAKLGQNFGTVLRAKGEKKLGESEGGEGGGLVMLGKAMTGLGTSVAVLAGVVAGLYAIFKVAQMVEEQIKETNRELIDTYGASDLLATGMNNVGEAVNQIRKGFADADFAMAVGLPLDQARQLAHTFNDININFGSLQDQGLNLSESIELMKNMTIEFQASAKTLGVDFGTLVGFSKEFRQELGVSVKDGQYLERMSKEFGRIRDLAKQSSLNTKDFFGVIQDLSSGIGNMNVRIGEAAQLFVNLSKVLGPEAAQAFTKGLAGGFKGEGIQDRFKRIILTGGLKNVMKSSAQQTKKDFFSMFGSNEMKSLMGSIGIDKGTDLSKMTDAELERAMGVLRRKGGAEGEGAARKLLSAVRLSRGGAGGLSQQALALGDLDMTGALSAQMKQLYNVTGGKGFRDVTAIEMEKISQMTGKSIEELEQMRMLDMAMRDDFRVLKELEKDAYGRDAQLDEDKMRAALKSAGLDKNLQVKDGKIVDNQGRIIDNIQDYIQAQGAELDKVQTDRYDQLSLLQDIVNETMNSADMIANEIKAMAQQLDNPLQFLADVMGKEDNRQQKREASAQLEADIETGRASLLERKKADRDKLSKERRQASAIKDASKRSAKLAEIKAKELENKKSYEQEEIRLSNMESQRNILLGAEGRKITGTNVEEIKSQALALNQRKLSRTKAGRAQLTDEQAIVAQAFRALEAGGIDTKNMQATKENLISLLTTAQGEISEEGDVKSKEELSKMYEILSRSGVIEARANVTGKGHEIKGGAAGYLTHGIAELFGNVAGISSGVEDSRSTQSKFFLRDKEGRTLSGSTSEGHKEGSSVFGIGVTDDKNYSGGKARAGVQVGSERDKQLTEEAIKQGMLAEEQLNALKNIQNPTDAETKKRAELEAQVQAKNTLLKDAQRKTQVQAILEADREKLQTQVRNEFDQQSLNLSEKGTRDSKIAALNKKIEDEKAKGEGADQFELNRLQQLRSQFRMLYAEDAISNPNSRPILLRGGDAVVGQTSDSVAFFDRSKGGGAPMGGASIINNITINGNNTASMLETLKRANQAQGMA